MKYELLLNLTEEYGGILKTADILKAGVSKTYFLDYVRANHFEKLANGIYLSPDAWRDELYILQLRFPGLIYSHNVSLYLFDLNDREPTKYTATVRRGYNAKKPRELGVTVYTVKRELYEMGVTTAMTATECKCGNAGSSDSFKGICEQKRQGYSYVNGVCKELKSR